MPLTGEIVSNAGIPNFGEFSYHGISHLNDMAVSHKLGQFVPRLGIGIRKHGMHQVLFY